MNDSCPHSFYTDFTGSLKHAGSADDSTPDTPFCGSFVADPACPAFFMTMRSPVHLRRNLKRVRTSILSPSGAPPESFASSTIASRLIPAPCASSESFASVITSPPGTAFTNVVNLLNSRPDDATAKKYGKSNSHGRQRVVTPTPVERDLTADLDLAAPAAAPAPAAPRPRGRVSECTLLRRQNRELQTNLAAARLQIQQLQLTASTRCPVSTPDLVDQCQTLQAANIKLLKKVRELKAATALTKAAARSKKYRANKKAKENKRVIDAARKVLARKKQANLDGASATSKKKPRKFKKNVKARATSRRVKAVATILGQHFDELLEVYDLSRDQLGLAVLRQEGQKAVVVRKQRFVAGDDGGSTWDPLQDRQLGRNVFLVDHQNISITKYRAQWNVGGGVAPNAYNVACARDLLDEEITKLGVLLEQVGVQPKKDSPDDPDTPPPP
jgi:hypothetical protein